jgi:cell division protein FtsB
MREFQEKRAVKRRIYSKTSLAILLVVLVLVAKGVYGVYQKEKESRIEVERTSHENATLQARYETIERGGEELKRESGIEAEIRSKFDVVKPGEGVIIVVDKNPTSIEQNKQGVLKKFWNSVMNIFH